MTELTLTQPDDWHLHLRDGAALAAVVGYTARQFRRAVIMPNLKPPVTRVAAALEYRQRILASVPDGLQFEPLMTLYLTDATSVEEVRRAADEPAVLAFKLYPAGATTNSEAGVTALAHINPVLEQMERSDVPLLIHGEVTDPEVDVFDREKVFIERELAPLAERFPGLRIVLEHVTTREGVDFVRQSGPNIAGTLTAHHLLYNRNAMLAGGIRPHYFCLPILKREPHRLALLDAASSGNPKFFLGTDSAPHAQHAKENACGCAGCFTAPVALELYAEAFDAVGRLDRLEAFSSFNGPDFYRLPRNVEKIRLTKTTSQIPATLPFGEDCIVPFRAGETLNWSVA